MGRVDQRGRDRRTRGRRELVPGTAQGIGRPHLPGHDRECTRGGFPGKLAPMTLPPWLTPRRLALIAVAVIVGFVAYQRLKPPRYDTPEAAITAVLDAGAEAARDGRVKDMMSLVSAAYRGGDDGGPADRDELRAYLVMGLARDGAEVRYLSRDIEVEGGAARVSVSMVVVAGGLRGNAGQLDLELDLALEGDDWKVVSSRSAAVPAPPP